jgi:hypothetical protein
MQLHSSLTAFALCGMLRTEQENLAALVQPEEMTGAVVARDDVL